MLQNETQFDMLLPPL